MNQATILPQEPHTLSELAELLSAHYAEEYSVTFPGEKVMITVSTKDGICAPVSILKRGDAFLVYLEGHLLPYHHAEDIISVIDFWMKGNLASVCIRPEGGFELVRLLPMGAHEDPHKWAADALPSILADDRSHSADQMDGAEFSLRTAHPRMWVDGIIRFHQQTLRLFTEHFDYEARMKTSFTEALGPIPDLLSRKGLQVELDAVSAVLTATGGLPHQRLVICDYPARRHRFDLQFATCPLVHGTSADLIRTIGQILSHRTSVWCWYVDDVRCLIEYREDSAIPREDDAIAWCRLAERICQCRLADPIGEAAPTLKQLSESVRLEVIAWNEAHCGAITFTPTENGLRPSRQPLRSDQA